MPDCATVLPPGYGSIRPQDSDGFGNAIGPVFLDEVGQRLAFRVGLGQLNPVGFCHGGALSAFADMQGAAIRASVCGLVGHTPTISLSIDFVAGVRLGELVEMDVTLVRVTNRMLFTQALLGVAGINIGRSNAIYRWYGVQHANGGLTRS